MTPDNTQMERLGELLGIAIDGDITENERTELNEMIRSSEEAQHFFHRYIDLHTELQWMLNPDVLDIPTGLDTIPFPTSQTAQPRTKKRVKFVAITGWIGLAAALAVMLILGRPQYDPLTDYATHSNDTDVFVARANYSADAQLGELSTIVRDGEWISPGKIVLDKGTLGLTFDSGALVVLNAPAEFDVETHSRGFLHSGQVVAQVPEPAIGFIINTPNSTIVDLGTEFTVNVDGDESTVKVLTGEVHAYAESSSGASEDVILTQDEAVRISDRSPEAFSNADDFEHEQFYNWDLFYQPDANYIHFNFDTEKGNNRTLSDGTWDEVFAARYLNADDTSTTVPTTIPGVFGKALNFNGDGEFAATNFEGISGAQARTISCWIKLPANSPNPAPSIVSWGEHRRGRHWQVSINNVPQFGTRGAIRTNFSSGYVIGSTDLRDGRWHHIASVYIGGNSSDIGAHIRHYVDGKLELVSAIKGIPNDIDTTTDTSRTRDNLKIGLRKRRNQPIKTLHGAIDELYIFDAAILPSQITNLRDFNTPDDSQAQYVTE